MTTIELELNLKKIIDESREVAQTINEFADNLERIESKYGDPHCNGVVGIRKNGRDKC